MGITTSGTDIQQTRDEIGSEPSVQGIYKIKTETVAVEEGPTLSKSRSIAGDVMIWGNDDFGVWNSSKWGSAPDITFILGNTLAAILGTSKLGDQSSEYVVWRVTNPNKTYHERFGFDTFNDTDVTTADWDTDNQKLDFTNAEIAQSIQVYKGTATITKATMSLTGTGTTNLALQLSTDGSSWENVTDGTQHTFTTTGTALYFKITASGVASLTKIQIAYQ